MKVLSAFLVFFYLISILKFINHIQSMSREYQFWVYMMASKSGVLYVGFSSNISRRVEEHKNELYPDSFSKRYKCHKLVYLEEFQYVWDALNRERQIKKWRRKKKEKLLEGQNPLWRDLSKEWELA